jgi:RNA polymerase sigma-70 factor (ECF subfamily)
MFNEKELIDGCKLYNRVAQNILYKKYSAKMYAVCMRYMKNKEEAEDMLHDGFIKVFSNINKYSSKGSLEGWIRRVIVNVILHHIIQKKKYKFDSLESSESNNNENSGPSFSIENSSTVDDSFEIEAGEYSKMELDKALDQVPEIYRLVFNLYHLDDLSHAEIATILSVDEATSRTRLFRAKKTLKEYLIKIKAEKRYREQGING